MSYQAFALKYRPKNFDEVIGQEHVVVALKNAIASKRVHHAYLFSGQRGVGKTSLARIFAKSLNCDNGPTHHPCEKCLSCTGITKGNSLDVIEIDGASNRGVDEIRILRESVKLKPAASRYKIYIIDEVHMLTQEAFNALLKTLEEPPPHVKFIFATTQSTKVLPTILSRCQKFQFSLFSNEKIIEKLKLIVAQEKITIGDEILWAIARSSGGSIRDAESLLDQIVPVILEKKDVKEIISFLGIIEEESLNKVVGAALEKNTARTIELIQEVCTQGKDIATFLSGLIEHMRFVLIAKVSPKTFKSIESISPSTQSLLDETSAKSTVQEVVKLIDLLIEAKDASRKLNSVRIPLELALVKYCLKDEVIVKKSVNNPGHHSARAESKREIKNDDLDIDLDGIDFEEPTPPTSLKKETKEVKDEATQVAVRQSSLTFEQISDVWTKIITDIGKTRVSLASYLSEATLESFDGMILRIGFEKRFSLHKEIVETKKNIQYIEEYLSKYLNESIVLRCIVMENTTTSKAASRKAQQESFAPDEENEFINELLDTFKGNLHTDE